MIRGFIQTMPNLLKDHSFPEKDSGIIEHNRSVTENPSILHGGNLRYFSELFSIPEESILDFSSNLNPLGPPENFRAVISSSISSVLSYPDPHSHQLIQNLSEFLEVPRETILPGNGLSELIHALPRALRPERIILPHPSYSGYERAAGISGIPVIDISSDSDFMIDVKSLREILFPGDLIFLAHPSNPSGRLLEFQKFQNLIDEFPGVYFVVDEAFIDFVPEAASFLSLSDYKNVIVLRSFTKIFSIPGLRLGCLIASADLCRRISSELPEWSVNSLAQHAGSHFLKNRDFIHKSALFTEQERRYLISELSSLNQIYVYESSSAYLLCRIKNSRFTALDLQKKLIQDYRILIRDCKSYRGLDESHFRIAVKNHEENQKLLLALKEIFRGKKQTSLPKKKTPSLMIQGTSSNAGKSLIVSALCRILLNDGIQTAPFKAQNMSLNSFVTLKGEEIARAQAVQAAACRLEPDIRMSPVLLKPGSDQGSQVLVNGKPIGNMAVKEYQKIKKELFATIQDSYDSLSSDFDTVILEGAGSPGEVNLKKFDIVNMNMARHAESPVLIAGDIDRGGVYASFVGTMEVIDEWARNLVQGFIVNKFRGDSSLLNEAHSYTKLHTGKDIIGVIPYLKDLRIPEEDSVSFKEQKQTGNQFSENTLNIGVIDLPYISNFTDLDPFYYEINTALKLARTPEDLINADVVILPGSKNTFHDLKFLYEKGFADFLRELSKNGHAEIIGICAGMQMLGQKLKDPHGIESSQKTAEGLGLIAIETVHGGEKILRRTSSLHKLSGCTVSGYEVHHGRTVSSEPGRVREVLFSNGEAIGFSSSESSVWGVYLHGIFDSPDFRTWFLNRMRRKKGLTEEKNSPVFSLDEEFDRLADAVRSSLDMDQIYKIMGLSA